MTNASRLADNLQDVKSRMAAACHRANRPVDSVRLIAVTKSAPVAWIRELIALGQTDLAENRPQQLMQRAAELPDTVRWHMIGHLQRNKVELLWPQVTCIHAIDSERLWQRAAEVAAKSDHQAEVLLEVNVSGETTKGGFAPSELLSLWPRMQQCQVPRITGLMTMAPLTDDESRIRAVFHGLRELRDQLVNLSEGRHPLPELSMGMSGDFEIAIEAGATMVRVGSRLFEGLS